MARPIGFPVLKPARRKLRIDDDFTRKMPTCSSVVHTQLHRTLLAHTTGAKIADNAIITVLVKRQGKLTP